MAVYVLTVFDGTGKVLVDERFDAKDDAEAKKLGESKIAELKYETYSSRVTKSSGGLVLFHQ
ncbi:hypothetical protein DS745_13425 [Anaerobacillus alkaliphilus]|uniref:YhzD-like protein n=1 Tax=Anaerobacillus alkaliphilus TaxID=1548597 RepID=A0A4Q0VRX3_9BACI|nr:YhzD family protein [Anaerobacillus alkaliphilus]RXI99875.1 hypothetical protein DS745_13425 [Anaerobacillus alkaliphilus]